MTVLFGAAVYAGAAYGVWSLIDALDDDPHDPAPFEVRWLFPLLWPFILPIFGLGMLAADLADHAKARRD